MRKGFVLIIMVIIIASVLSVIAVSTALASITFLESSDSLMQGKSAEYSIEGCVHEALIQLRRDSSYMGGDITLEDVNCEITVLGAGNERNLIISGNQNDFYRTFDIDIALEPLQIIDWDE